MDKCVRIALGSVFDYFGKESAVKKQKNKKRKGCVYCAKFPNGKLYIGQTIQKFSIRKRQHLYDAKRRMKYPVQKAINKYGPDNIEWKILYESDNIEDLNHAEKFYIKEFKTLVGENGYNLESGGLNYEVHESTKKRMSVAIKKRNECGKSPNARLTWNEVKNIRKKYLSGEYTRKLLSKEYDMTEDAIFYIIRNRSWKDDKWYEENKNLIDKISKKNIRLGCFVNGIRRRTLDEKSIKEIREIYHNSKITQKKLAEKYGISESSIHYIICNKTYFDHDYQKFLDNKNENN